MYPKTRQHCGNGSGETTHHPYTTACSKLNQTERMHLGVAVTVTGCNQTFSYNGFQPLLQNNDPFSSHNTLPLQLSHLPFAWYFSEPQVSILKACLESTSRIWCSKTLCSVRLCVRKTSNRNIRNGDETIFYDRHGIVVARCS